MNRNEERRELSKKILVAMLSYKDDTTVPDFLAYQKNLANIVVGYADALLDELDKVENPKERPVATGDVQVGDLVMVRQSEVTCWYGPILLQRIDINNQDKFYVGIDKYVVRWRQARHLTDKERNQIKRI